MAASLNRYRTSSGNTPKRSRNSAAKLSISSSVSRSASRRYSDSRTARSAPQSPGNKNRHAHGDLWRPAIRRRFDHAGLEVEDRLFQHRLIELEADFLDMPGLFLAEQIAGAADIQIVRCQLESGAEGFQRLQHF